MIYDSTGGDLNDQDHDECGRGYINANTEITSPQFFRSCTVRDWENGDPSPGNYDLRMIHLRDTSNTKICSL